MNEKLNTPVPGIIKCIALLAIASFWVCFGGISWYQRFATDDFALIGFLNHKGGIIGSTIYLYFNWGGTLFGTLLQNITLWLCKDSIHLAGYNLFLLFFLSSSVYFFLYQLALYFKGKATALNIFIISQLLIQAIFFSGYCISENWFWVVGSTAYIYPFCVIFFSIGFYIRYQLLHGWINLAVSLVCALVFATYPINYVSVACFIAGVLFSLHFFQTKKIERSNVLYTLMLIAGAAINVLAPGNQVRLKKVTSIIVAALGSSRPTFLHEILTCPVILFKKVFAAKLIYMLIFIVPAVYLFVVEYNNATIPFKYSALLFLFFIVSIFFNVAIMYKVYGWGLGSPRSHINITLLSVAFLAVFVATLALKFKNTSQYLGYVTVLLLLAATYLNVKTFYTQLPVVKKYAAATDHRMQTILSAKGVYTRPVLYLDSLPPAGILFSAEMGRDTSYYINQDMKTFFDLPFGLVVK